MLAASPKSASTKGVILPASENRTFTESLIGPRLSAVLRKKSIQRVLALFTVGNVYASLCKKGTYAPFSAQRRSRALFWL